MRSRQVLTAVILALAVGLMAPAEVDGTTGAIAAPDDRLLLPTTSGRVLEGEASGPIAGFDGDRAVLDVSASSIRGGTETSAQGEFRFAHEAPDGTALVTLKGAVDCLMVSGSIATFSGRVTTVVPAAAASTWLGHRVGFSVADQGHHDGFGWSWMTGHVGSDVAPCLSTAPFLRADSGNLVVISK